MMEETTENNEDPSLLDLAEQLDHQGMVGYVQRFVEDMRQGFTAIQDDTMPWLEEIRRQHWNGVLCIGMGGSAAGGDFLASLASHHGSMPLHVHRDYRLPAWFDESYLVLATSHSGNTEETVQAAEAALAKGATVIVIATGGVLAGLAETSPRCHLIPTVGGQPPRSAFGHIFSRQVACMESLGILPSSENGRENMLERLEEVNKHFDITRNPEGDVALLAAAMVDQPLAIIGPTEMMPALNRFKNQVNENAGRFVRMAVLPEMNHNESVAWGGIGEDGDPARADQVLLFLTWNHMHPRVEQRLQWMIAHASTELAWNLVGEGDSLMEALLYQCLIMDWLSVTLALLQGKDPAAIAPIASLKNHLDSVQ
ncbi:MAG: SIS domain-containing protein [Candidatus Poseidonia sp.]|nr:SIS domain-containing protein [Poseidonia sp.]